MSSEPSDIDLAAEAIKPWDELIALRRSSDGLYLGIGFLEGLAAGIQFFNANDRSRAAEQIREAAIELRELLPGSRSERNE